MGDSEMIAYVQVDALTRVSGPTDRCDIVRTGEGIEPTSDSLDR